MKAALKKKWIAALRSGKYKQGIEQLYNRSTRGYCCLGVLGRCAGLRFDGDRGLLIEEREIAIVGVTDYQQRQLAGKNDGGQSFETIATWIEKNL